MDIFLLDPAGGQLHLPVNPIGDITIRREKQIETVNIINIGEIDFASGEKVKEITFSSFFPKEYDSGYCRYPDISDPQQAMNQVTAWMMSKKPIRLIITDTVVNVLVLVSAHTSQFRGGEPGDVYYDLTLRTWREIKVRTTADLSTSGAGQGAGRPDLKPTPKVYVVKPGDSLWKIAKMELRDGAKWRDIYSVTENQKVIGPDPNVLQVGQRLVLPA